MTLVDLRSHIEVQGMEIQVKVIDPIKDEELNSLYWLGDMNGRYNSSDHEISDEQYVAVLESDIGYIYPGGENRICIEVYCEEEIWKR